MFHPLQERRKGLSFLDNLVLVHLGDAQVEPE